MLQKINQILLVIAMSDEAKPLIAELDLIPEEIDSLHYFYRSKESDPR